MNALNTTTVENPAPNQSTAPRARVRPPTLTTDKAVEKFVEIRDRIAALKKEQALALAPFNVALSVLEAWLLDDLNTSKVESMRATTGTVFKTIRTSATVESWSDTLEYIKANDAWELLEARVSKTAVEALMADTKKAVPGVKTSRETVLNVRRA